MLVRIGKIAVTDSKYGLVLTPDLQGLYAELHGFHVHQNPSCDAKEKEGRMTPSLAAGGHLDPTGINKHGEPGGEGHLGDLPPIYVDSSDNPSQPIFSFA